jgi:hypothetical protein
MIMLALLKVAAGLLERGHRGEKPWAVESIATACEEFGNRVHALAVAIEPNRDTTLKGGPAVENVVGGELRKQAAEYLAFARALRALK